MFGNVQTDMILFCFLILQSIRFLHCQRELNDKMLENFSEYCDFITDNAICLDDELLTIQAQPENMIAYYNFDDQFVLDNSLYLNHVKKEIQLGPSFSATGSSAYFTGENPLEINHIPEYSSKSFTYTFWFFLIDDSSESGKPGNKWCPILQKGEDDEYNNVFYRSPALFINKQTKELKFMISTTDKTMPKGEWIISNGKVQPRRWTHIALIRQDKKLKLYLNGVLDSINATIGYTQVNEKSLYVGCVPWHKDDCSISSYIDDLRVYTRAINEFEIEAEASPALGFVEPNFVQLGCINCELKIALSSCISDYHICTSIELHTAGYHVAKAMGWMKWKTIVWQHSDEKEKQKNVNDIGLVLCCKDI